MKKMFWCVALALLSSGCIFSSGGDFAGAECGCNGDKGFVCVDLGEKEACYKQCQRTCETTGYVCEEYAPGFSACLDPEAAALLDASKSTPDMGDVSDMPATLEDMGVSDMSGGLADMEAPPRDMGTLDMTPACSGDGQRMCGNACVDTYTDGDHCGVCNTPCGNSQSCEQGACSCEADGFSVCPSLDGPSNCFNLDIDSQNCGACGVVCEEMLENSVCSGGSCGCRAGELSCNNECVPQNKQRCGDCDTSCSTGQACNISSGTCECPQGSQFVQALGECGPVGMVYVSGGEFTMGKGSEGTAHSPAHAVRLTPYFIDTYEVTVADYKRCVDAGSCAAPAMTFGDDERYNYGAQNRQDHPVTGVLWQQAQGYCAWAGKRLPTEAEWELAARGKSEIEYPWGNIPAPDASHCGYAVVSCVAMSPPFTEPVGSKPLGVSPYGAYDMSGNVWELVSDWYRADYYATSSAGGTPLDPQGPPAATAEFKVKRGGGFGNRLDEVTTYFRYSHNVTTPRENLGFRCAINAN